ncbi:MAG: hypothetical protein GY822_03765 [Deltaproteobacteria bacterium]|nr:hypothetical protein [Deltaproteobacteria bacterium]
MSGDLECLVHDPSASQLFVVGLSACQSCSASVYLTVESLDITFDDEGEPSEALNDVVKNVRIGAEGMQRLTDAWSESPDEATAQKNEQVLEIEGDLPPPTL